MQQDLPAKRRKRHARIPFALATINWNAGQGMNIFPMLLPRQVRDAAPLNFPHLPLHQNPPGSVHWHGAAPGKIKEQQMRRNQLSGPIPAPDSLRKGGGSNAQRATPFSRCRCPALPFGMFRQNVHFFLEMPCPVTSAAHGGRWSVSPPPHWRLRRLTPAHPI